jgi:hypothetical protein
MKSFDVEAEPAASPRLAAMAALFHATAAALPWVARVPAPLAAFLSLLAVTGFAWTVARLPGRHSALAALRITAAGCSLRLSGSPLWQHAELTQRSRAYADLLVVDLHAGGRRYGWVVARECLSPRAFRRLKARVGMDARICGSSHARRGFRPPNHDLAN